MDQSFHNKDMKNVVPSYHFQVDIFSITSARQMGKATLLKIHQVHHMHLLSGKC